MLGRGKHRFKVVEGWGYLPDGITYGYTHGVAVDANDRVYIFNTGSNAIVVFDQEGNFLRSFGESFKDGAHGFYLHQENGEEYLYVTDTGRGRMVKMTLDGDEVLTLSTSDMPRFYDEERKFAPTDVAVAPNGDIYIADGYGQDWIHQFSGEGTHIRSWGGMGTGEGRLSCPHGISINMRGTEPEVYVADRGHHRIQVFTLDGVHKRSIVEDLDMPCSFYFYKDEVYLPDLHSRVTILDRGDKLIAHLGEDREAYSQPGWPNLPKVYYRPERFSSPHGICVDSKGDVYVAEWISDGRVTKLQRVREGEKLEALIFDLDGTLFCAETVLLPAYKHTFETLREEGLYTGDAPSEQLILSGLGMLLTDIWQRVIPGASEQARQRANELLLSYQLKELQSGEGKLYPAVQSTLSLLREQGYLLFLASNGLEQYVKDVARHMGIGQYFTALYSAGEFQTKSKVDLVRILLDDHPVHSAWMVGDRSSDVEAGKANGLFVVGCDYSGFGKPEELQEADMVIRSFAELLQYIK